MTVRGQAIRWGEERMDALEQETLSDRKRVLREGPRKGEDDESLRFQF